jgi:hypothetical protein
MTFIPTLSRSGRISDEPEPDDGDLREGRWIDLSHIPASDAAGMLADAVAEIVARHQERSRPLGAAGWRTLVEHVGLLLGGILRPALRGRPVVSVHASAKGGVWDNVVLGHHAAWGRLDAMTNAGLVSVRKGVRTTLFGGDDPIYGGLPTRVWATSKLLSMASECGVTAHTLDTDWIIHPEVQRALINVKRADLIVMRGLGRGAGHVPIPRSQASEAEKMRDKLAALNAHVRTVEITGCLPPAYRRVFRADLRLGGRFYAVGGSNYQNLAREDRALIRIGGEPVVEVDLHAAFLTLLLGLSGVRKLPADDLYGAVGLPRAVTKAWTVQTFATGTLASRWSRQTPAEVTALGIKASEVRKAALQTYPALGELTRIVPSDLLRRLPEDRLGWAVGQYLTNLESRVMDAALPYIAQWSIVGLPMHDSIIVPASAAWAARNALEGACWAVAHVEPRVKVSAPALLPDMAFPESQESLERPGALPGTPSTDLAQRPSSRL